MQKPKHAASLGVSQPKPLPRCRRQERLQMLTIVKDAFAKAARKPLTWIALVAIPLIVGCFGLLYYGTFMDPYERMKDLPVAIINEDAGATMNGEQRNFGDELVDSIMENDAVKWTLEDASLLDSGLGSSGYFVAVVIPEDFSSRACAGQTAEPEQADITFFKNVRKNFMFSTLSSSIESTLRTTVNQKISEQYATAYLKGLQSTGDGMSEAANGAGKLADGITTAKDGSEQLADGANSLHAGASSLSDGLGTLASGAQALEGGVRNLAAGTNTLSSGLTNLSTGARALDEGVAAVSDGASQLAATGNALTSGSCRVAEGVSQLADGSSAFSETLQSTQNALAQQFGGDPANAIPALQAAYAQAL